VEVSVALDEETNIEQRRSVSSSLGATMVHRAA
jgi:hypothetical protein